MKADKARAIERAKEDAEHYRGVECLAFEILEFPATGGRYHAFGVYRAGGELRVRHAYSDFAVRVPDTPKGLYLDTLGSVEDEKANARSIAERWALPDGMARLIAEASE